MKFKKIIKVFYYLPLLLVTVSCSMDDDLRVYPPYTDNSVLKLTFNDVNYLTANEKGLIGIANINLVENQGSDMSNCIEVRYVGYDLGSIGVNYLIDLPQRLQEATLNFEVNFTNDFKFVKGGKLHGFGSADPITAGNEIKPNDWSSRIMFKDSGKVSPYIYHQDMTGTYGEGENSEYPVFESGKWHKVAMYVKLNTQTFLNDGIFELWVDNVLIKEVKSLRYRGNISAPSSINKFLFSTFHGGNTPQWAPTNEQGDYTVEVALFDNFYIYEGKHIVE